MKSTWQLLFLLFFGFLSRRCLKDWNFPPWSHTPLAWPWFFFFFLCTNETLGSSYLRKLLSYAWPNWIDHGWLWVTYCFIYVSQYIQKTLRKILSFVLDVMIKRIILYFFPVTCWRQWSCIYFSNETRYNMITYAAIARQQFKGQKLQELVNTNFWACPNSDLD